MNTRPGETSSGFRKNEASLEAAATAHDRGNEGQAATNLPHDAINNGEPKTAAGADRRSANERFLQNVESLGGNDGAAIEQPNLPAALDNDLDRLVGSTVPDGIFDQVAERDAENVQFPLHDEFVPAFRGDDQSVSHALVSAQLIDQHLQDSHSIAGLLQHADLRAAPQ